MQLIIIWTKRYLSTNYPSLLGVKVRIISASENQNSLLAIDIVSTLSSNERINDSVP